jgi:hypothetical protein
MGIPYLTYTLLMLTTFHNGDTNMFPFPARYPQEVCEKQAAEDNMNWKLYGDHETFRSVKFLCLPNRILP